MYLFFLQCRSAWNSQKDSLLPDGYCPVQPLRQHFAEVQSLFDAIEKEAKSHAEIANYLTMALITKLAAFLREEGLQEEQQTPTLAAKARAFIDKNYKEAIRLGDIATATHTNSYYLSHLFKAEIGLSPMKYVILRRIGEAQTLLIDTTLPITEIAIRTGYNSSSYFNKAFHKITGMSPRDYRKAYRKI